MLRIFDFILSIFPTEWLSHRWISVEEEEAGVEIKHPLNKDYYLSVLILPERTGIALLYEDENEILLDLGGFDYSFEKWEEAKLQLALLNFRQIGQFKR